MKAILRFLYGLNPAISIIATVLGIVCGIITIRHEIKGANRSTLSKFAVCTLTVLVAVIVILGVWAHTFLAEVPDVAGITYEDAKRKISDVGLKYTLDGKEDLYVESQSIEPGEIVRKGEVLALTLKSISSHPDVIKAFEELINAEYGQLSVRFYSALIEFWNEENKTRCFGPVIENPVILDAYLVQPEYGVKYDNYTVDGDYLIFERIPVGIPFILVVIIDGYEQNTIENITLSSENSVNKIHTLDIGIVPKDTELGLATSFRVGDDKGNFLSGIKVEVKFQYEDMWYGDYKTDADGRFEQMILLNSSQQIEVCLLNPLGTGSDIYCQVELRRISSGETFDNDIIVLSQDDSYKVVKESEIFGY